MIKLLINDERWHYVTLRRIILELMDKHTLLTCKQATQFFSTAGHNDIQDPWCVFVLHLLIILFFIFQCQFTTAVNSFHICVQWFIYSYFNQIVTQPTKIHIFTTSLWRVVMAILGLKFFSSIEQNWNKWHDC